MSSCVGESEFVVYLFIAHSYYSNNKIYIYLKHRHALPYSGFLSREKTFANFAFLWRFARVFSAKIYFQVIRYRASGRGALGYRKFAKVFSAKFSFCRNAKVFRYTVYHSKIPAASAIYISTFYECYIRNRFKQVFRAIKTEILRHSP